MLGRLHHEKEPCGGGVFLQITKVRILKCVAAIGLRSSEYAAKGKMKNALRCTMHDYMYTNTSATYV